VVFLFIERIIIIFLDVLQPVNGNFLVYSIIISGYSNSGYTISGYSLYGYTISGYSLNGYNTSGLH